MQIAAVWEVPHHLYTLGSDLVLPSLIAVTVVEWATLGVAGATLALTIWKTSADIEKGKDERQLARATEALKRKEYYEPIRDCAKVVKDMVHPYVQTILDGRGSKAAGDEFRSAVQSLEDARLDARPYISRSVDRASSNLCFSALTVSSEAHRCVLLNLGDEDRDEVLTQANETGRTWGDLENAIAAEMAGDFR